MIYFWCPDSDVPAGGVKQIYRQAQVLATSGIEACIVHSRRGFSCTWFEHDGAQIAYLGESLVRHTRQFLGNRISRFAPGPDFDLSAGRRIHMASGGERTVTVSDVVVLPEYLSIHPENAPMGVPLVIFNQGAYLTFKGQGVEPAATIYELENTRGVICVSDDSRRYLQTAFPDLPVFRVVNGVDSALFRPSAAERGQRIAFMPRKLPNHAEQVFQILHRRGSLEGWEILPIDNMSQQQVAMALRSSSIFLNLAAQEGFGLPPVEAGLSGCLVVGYTGFGGREFFLPEFTWPVETNDILGVVTAIEKTLALITDDPQEVERRRLGFRNLLRERYSLEAEAASFANVWRELNP